MIDNLICVSCQDIDDSSPMEVLKVNTILLVSYRQAFKPAVKYSTYRGWLARYILVSSAQTQGTVRASPRIGLINWGFTLWSHILNQIIST